jgi:magnesium-transporting ATPase (P-type)
MPYPSIKAGFMSDLENATSTATPYGKKAMIFSVLATVGFFISAVLTAYGILCPTSRGMCLPSTINSFLSGTSVFLLTAGTLLGIVAVRAAVESIAVKEHTPKPYVAIALLVISILGIVGDVYQFLVIRLVEIVFHVNL